MEQITLDELLASAPPEAGKPTVVVPKAPLEDQNKVIQALGDWAIHRVGKVATKLFGLANKDTRGKLRKIRDAVNQDALEGRGHFYIQRVKKGYIQLKTVAGPEEAEAILKEEKKLIPEDQE